MKERRRREGGEGLAALNTLLLVHHFFSILPGLPLDQGLLRNCLTQPCLTHTFPLVANCTDGHSQWACILLFIVSWGRYEAS